MTGLFLRALLGLVLGVLRPSRLLRELDAHSARPS
jgi:hypothetical protein